MNKLADSKILIVDDESDITEVLSDLFINAGYGTVEVANSKDEALTKLTNEAFDALISDVQMVGGSGIELVRAAKETKVLPKVSFFLSGYSETVEAEAKVLEVTGVLPKPFALHTLVKTVSDKL